MNIFTQPKMVPFHIRYMYHPSNASSFICDVIVFPVLKSNYTTPPDQKIYFNLFLNSHL